MTPHQRAKIRHLEEEHEGLKERWAEYILASEPGTSCVAAGWRKIGEAGGGSWSRKCRPRIDKHPKQGKMLFEKTL